MLAHKSEVPYKWTPYVAFPTPAPPQCTIPLTLERVRVSCFFVAELASMKASTEKDFAVEEKAQLKLKLHFLHCFFFCLFSFFGKNGHSPDDDVTI